MLYIAYFIIVSGHNIKKMIRKILLPSATLKMDRALLCTLVGRVGGWGCSLPPARKILRRGQITNTLSKDISAMRSP